MEPDLAVNGLNLPEFGMLSPNLPKMVYARPCFGE
jgi:hypothetical protein